MKRIIICGFSGAGKSSAIASLRKSARGQSHFKYWDLDEKICEDLEIRLDELGDWISNNGLEQFRELELEVLQQVIRQDNFVLALGAGALHPLSIDLLNRSNVDGVWLDIPFEVCWERICDDKNRPLVKLGKEKLQSLYKKRQDNYRRFFRVDSLESLMNKLKDLGVLVE